jgi:hypothetical protein
MKAEDILPDGQDTVQVKGHKVRKGSVAAFVANVGALTDPQTPPAEREACLRHLRELVPSLRVLQLFDVFELRDPGLRELVRQELRRKPGGAS